MPCFILSSFIIGVKEVEFGDATLVLAVQLEDDSTSSTDAAALSYVLSKSSTFTEKLMLKFRILNTLH